MLLLENDNPSLLNHSCMMPLSLSLSLLPRIFRYPFLQSDLGTAVPVSSTKLISRSLSGAVPGAFNPMLHPKKVFGLFSRLLNSFALVLTRILIDVSISFPPPVRHCRTSGIDQLSVLRLLVYGLALSPHFPLSHFFSGEINEEECETLQVLEWFTLSSLICDDSIYMQLAT